MNTVLENVALMAALGFLIPGIAAAQQAPPPAAAAPADKPMGGTAQSEAGEPRADTSGEAPATAAPATGQGAPTTGQAAPATGQAAPATGRGARRGAVPSASGEAAARKTAAGHLANGAGQKSTNPADQLALGTATVTGSQEQPKVMYIVPWKRSDIGDLAGKPMNSLVDEILAPVDRDVFKREVVYYQVVQADAPQNGASPKPSQQGEK